MRNGYEAATLFSEVTSLIVFIQKAVNVAIESLSYVLHFFKDFANTQKVQRKYSGSTHISFSISDTTLKTLTLNYFIFSFSFPFSFLFVYLYGYHWGETRKVQSSHLHSSIFMGHLFQQSSHLRYTKCKMLKALQSLSDAVVGPSVSLDSASANRKADCASLRGDSIGNRRWHRLHDWVGVGNPVVLGWH